MKNGDRLLFWTSTSNGSIIKYKAAVVKVTSNTYTVQIPDCVRDLPFPPGGKNPETGRGYQFLTYSKKEA